MMNQTPDPDLLRLLRCTKCGTVTAPMVFNLPRLICRAVRMFGSSPYQCGGELEDIVIGTKGDVFRKGGA